MSLKRTHNYWRDVVGLELDKVSSSPVIVSHQPVEGYHDFRGYHGAFILQRAESLAISVPPGLVRRIEEMVSSTKSSSLKLLYEMFADYSDRIVGPAVQAFLEPDDFTPAHKGEARALSPNDFGLILDLQRACDPASWSHGGISPKDNDLFGSFAGVTLVSVAKLLPWNAKANNVGVVTHPAFRGRGYGAVAASAVVEKALEANKLVLYQTLKSNIGAIKLAQKLGFEIYGESLSIRFGSSFV
mgnify:CR=1 FL=1